jgi:hypothetical protein
MTVTGVNVTVAMSLLAAIGDTISRLTYGSSE